MIDEIAAALGAKKAVLLPALIGASLAVALGPRRAWPERVIGFGAGFFTSVYATSPVVSWLGAAPGDYLGGVAFTLGLFGMALADAIFRVIRDTNVAEIIKGRFGK